MKDKKHIKKFNEHQENLNISDVSISDITKGFKFKMYGNDLTITKDYEKNGEDRFVKATYIRKKGSTRAGKSAFVVLDKDVILNYLKNH